MDGVDRMDTRTYHSGVRFDCTGISIPAYSGPCLPFRLEVGQETWLRAVNLFQNQIIFFWILSFFKKHILMVKINNFRDDISNTSAKTATLVASTEMCASAKASILEQSLDRIPDCFILPSSARDVAHASASF